MNFFQILLTDFWEFTIYLDWSMTNKRKVC